jgi:hypothetical protein
LATAQGVALVFAAKAVKALPSKGRSLSNDKGLAGRFIGNVHIQGNPGTSSGDLRVEGTASFGLNLMRDGDIRSGNAPLSPETPPACWPKPLGSSTHRDRTNRYRLRSLHPGAQRLVFRRAGAMTKWPFDVRGELR